MISGGFIVISFRNMKQTKKNSHSTEWFIFSYRLTDEAYIDMDDVDINGRSALHLAACSNQRKTVECMINHHLCFPEAKDR